MNNNSLYHIKEINMWIDLDKIVAITEINNNVFSSNFEIYGMFMNKPIYIDYSDYNHPSELVLKGITVEIKGKEIRDNLIKVWKEWVNKGE